MTLDLRAIPRVMRTPMVTTNALVAEGSMFVDGRKRIFVPKATTDELIAELTADCVRLRTRAPCVRCSRSATATKMRSCSSVMPPP